MIDRGPESMDGFLNGLKGKIAEFATMDQLEDAGWSAVEIAQDTTQAVWDPPGISPEGTPEYWQVKNVGADQAGHIQQLMVENPDVNFALNSEVYDRITESATETAERMMRVMLRTGLRVGECFLLRSADILFNQGPAEGRRRPPRD